MLYKYFRYFHSLFFLVSERIYNVVERKRRVGIGWKLTSFALTNSSSCLRWLAQREEERGRQRDEENCARPLQFAAWPHSIAVWAVTLTVANKWPHNLSWQQALAKNELSHSKRPEHLPGLGRCARRVSFYQYVCVSLGVCVCVCAWVCLCMCVCCRPWLCLFAVRWTQCK